MAREALISEVRGADSLSTLGLSGIAATFFPDLFGGLYRFVCSILGNSTNSHFIGMESHFEGKRAICLIRK
jgi:hypothetical protein